MFFCVKFSIKVMHGWPMKMKMKERIFSIGLKAIYSKIYRLCHDSLINITWVMSEITGVKFRNLPGNIKNLRFSLGLTELFWFLMILQILINYSVANCKIFLAYRNSESKTSLLTGVQVPNGVKKLLDDPLNRGLILCGTCVKML